jgi:hypothetical protein
MNVFISKLKKPNLLKRLWERIYSYFYFEQWILLLTQDISNFPPSWNDFTRIMPPLDRIWADPFIWIRGGKYYIFFEEQPHDTKRGRICCITLDNNLKIIANEPVLERPYHLSYPFIFEHNETLYMIPETAQNRVIELYRCTQFPYQWEFEKKLMTGVQAYDATLFEHQGRWWLFANITEGEGSSWDTLNLFYSDDPLSENWTSHPNNPIVHDVRSARPAGRIFLRDGKIIRPSQNSSKRYGYALNFNRIVTLTELEFEEIHDWSFTPPSLSDTIATHTWNEAGNLRVIDAKILRSKR